MLLFSKFQFNSLSKTRQIDFSFLNKIDSLESQTRTSLDREKNSLKDKILSWIPCLPRLSALFFSPCSTLFACLSSSLSYFKFYQFKKEREANLAGSNENPYHITFSWLENILLLVPFLRFLHPSLALAHTNHRTLRVNQINHLQTFLLKIKG